jgi:hypothetical protein
MGKKESNPAPELKTQVDKAIAVKPPPPPCPPDRKEMADRLANNLDIVARDLFERDVDNPALGQKYKWTLRANILKDLARALRLGV